MFGLAKWQIYGLAALAGYFIYKNYFTIAAVAPVQNLPAPTPVTQGASAFPMANQYR